MTYLLSLLTAELPARESNQILCYYINDTADIQMIRAMSGSQCHFERLIFSRERFLFTALPDSYLEVYSSAIDGTQSRKVNCKALHVHEQSEPDKSTAQHQVKREMDLSMSTSVY